MCRVFARERLWERTQEGGDLVLGEWSSTPRNPPFIDYRGQECVSSNEAVILDPSYPVGHDLREVARIHCFRTASGTIGASGLPDPKELMIGGLNYRRIKKKNPHCELCEGGDMIAPEERFHDSTYRPALSICQRIRRRIRALRRVR